MIQIDEPLPEDPLASEVVLHLRRHLKHTIRSKERESPGALAMLFGFALSESGQRDWMEAAASPTPLLSGAAVAAARRGTSPDGVVALGHDDAHLTECKAWLLDRKRQDHVFDKLLATDLATLLELSKARDLAIAPGRENDGQDRALPILIQGETGTGKELLAEAIHELWSAGKQGAPFVVAQVAGLTPDLAIDELFGHVRGAFTNAYANRQGRIQAANGGTLLIDEVGDLPPEAQVRLLRFLQTQKVARTGEDTEHSVTVRVLAATWRNLEQMVEVGSFRKDLYHRLCYGTSLRLPPLVKREGFFEEVVPELLARQGHRVRPPLSRNARDALKLHKWPGNLREAVGVLKEAIMLAQGATIRLEHLPSHIQRQYLQRPLLERASGYLVEELDAQELSEEHVQWRATRLDQAMDQLTPPEDPSGAQVLKIVEALPHDTPEQQQTLEAVSDWRESRRLLQRHEIIAGYWANLSREELPEVVARVVYQKELERRAQADELRQQIDKQEQRVNELLEKHVWVNLLTDLRELPALREADGSEIAEAIGTIFNLLQSFLPNAAAEVLEHVRSRTLIAKLRGEVSTIVQTGGDTPLPPSSSPPETAPVRVQAKDRPLEFWADLTRRYETQAEAVKATNYDPKTIKEYLQKHNIPNPWARSSSNSP